MTDPAAASELRKLFTAKAGSYPYLLPEAEILFENEAGSKFDIKTKSPAETAEILQHIYNNEERSPFKRNTCWNVPGPLHFRMHKRARLGEDQKEHHLLAFNITIRDSAKPSHVWLSDNRMGSYYWQGDEKIEDTPPITCEGPALAELIAILRKAGDSWANVNFMATTHKGAHLRLVHNRL